MRRRKNSSSLCFRRTQRTRPRPHWRSSEDFPEGGEPALSGHDHPGKHSLGASSAQELPAPRLKAEISVGRSRLVRLIAASLPLPLVESGPFTTSIQRTATEQDLRGPPGPARDLSRL